jgi:hypothetical protein
VSVAHAVSAYTEHASTRVLAEGIETEEHLATALSLGATLGQGWYFGRPMALPAQLPLVKPWSAMPMQAALPAVSATQTPFDIIHSTRPVLEADGDMVVSMAAHLEQQAMELGPRGMVLTAIQDPERVRRDTFAVYERLATNGAFVGLFGEHVSELDLKGVALGQLQPSDRLCREWAVNVIGPHFSAALAARELEVGGGRFAFAVTHDRELVVRMAHPLLARLEQGDTFYGSPGG